MDSKKSIKPKNQENLEEKSKKSDNFKNKLIQVILLLVFGAAVFGGYYWKAVSGRIYVEKGQISAPEIDLSSQNDGILERLYVQEGDKVTGNTPVAQIGDEIIKAKESGVIIKTRNERGKLFNHGEAVATMINPQEFRVIGRVEEDKGLADIKIGQKVIFTADAFGSKEYHGIVDEISPTSHDSDIVFSVSDKRELKDFDIKVRFNINDYPELKNGMSAKIWVYKD